MFMARLSLVVLILLSCSNETCVIVLCIHIEYRDDWGPGGGGVWA